MKARRDTEDVLCNIDYNIYIGYNIYMDYNIDIDHNKRIEDTGGKKKGYCEAIQLLHCSSTAV